MNKRVLILFAVLIAVIFIFKFCNGKPEKKANNKEIPLAVSASSGSFKQSFHNLLDSYFKLKDAFIEGDTSQINLASVVLMKNADSLQVQELSADTSGTIRKTAKYFAETISSSTKAILGEKNIEEKRNELNMITDALWSLTRTVKYDGQKIYYQYCPMAFNNRGAYWLSETRDISNPYFGSKMPSCGETADSLDYSKR